ncbi:DUF1565 domain-containing protein [Myxococcota bacterium]|nr:DUF1565 domain-containing protein [Myxococcota bacterium]MBU1498312.1 DUF1565 domain-containing protein [Myxococcota bacterium]
MNKIFLLGALLFTFSACDNDSATKKTPDAPGCRGNMNPTQVMGNWDVVPYQIIDSTFETGVVAFHEEGVAVVFFANGQELGRVTEPTLNPRTGVHEYWVSVDPEDYDDGPVTITATIEPQCEGHISRELEPLVLYANSAGSLTNDNIRWVDCSLGDDTADGSEGTPYATIEKAFTEVGDGGTVHLKAGHCYKLTNNLPASDYTYWTTVRPAPGVTRDEVSILAAGNDESSTGRFGENMVRWQDVAIYKEVSEGYSTIFYFESGHHVWFDQAELYDALGQWNGGNPLNGNSPYYAYYTGAYVHDIMNAGYRFGRDVTMDNIGSDVFRGVSGILSVNLVVNSIDRGDTEAHPDFFQFYNPDSTVDNVVVYNTKVYNMGAQGIFGGEGEIRNVAFVNLLMEKDPADSALLSQITGDWDHVLLWHVTTVDSSFFLRELSQLRNFFIQNCIFSTLSAGPTVELPHFIIENTMVNGLVWDQPSALGENALVGDPLYVDEPNDDYHLRSDSPAYRAGAPLPGVVADVDGNERNTSAPSLGCYD